MMTNKPLLHLSFINNKSTNNESKNTNIDTVSIIANNFNTNAYNAENITIVPIIVNEFTNKSKYNKYHHYNNHPKKIRIEFNIIAEDSDNIRMTALTQTKNKSNNSIHSINELHIHK